MDNITQLYWQLHAGESFNFYKLSGFRAGYNLKQLRIVDFDNLPDALVKDYSTGWAEGRDAKIGER